jgi:hypothetical protein
MSYIRNVISSMVPAPTGRSLGGVESVNIQDVLKYVDVLLTLDEYT